MKNRIIIIAIIVIIAIAGIFVIKNRQSRYDFETTKITSFEYFTLISNEKYGIINKNGEIIIKPEYTEIIIPNPQKDIFFCYKDDEVEILNSKGEKIYTNFQKVEPIKLKNVATTLNYEKSVFKFKKDNSYGLINLDGKIIVKDEYESIENLQLCEGIFLVKKNGKYGIINLNGAVIIRPEYDSISSDGYYNEKDGYKKAGFIVFNKTEDGYRYGYFNNTGKLYLNAEYNSIARILKDDKNIKLIASKEGKYGLYNNNKKIIDEEYQSIEYDENSSLLIIEKNKKYGMADLDGKIIIEPENNSIEIKGIYIYAKQALENKVYDKLGNKVNISFNKCIYETENENYRISTIDNNDITYYGIVDKNGNTLVSEKLQYIEYAFGTYFIAKNEENKYGIINSNGKEVIDYKYSFLQKVKGKNIVQAVDNSTGVTDFYSSNLNKLVSVKNASISNEEEYIKITSDNETFYFDKDGNKIDENADIIKKSYKLQEPDKIGKYKKIQFTLENVYYIE